MEPLEPGKVTPTRTFLILVGCIGAFWCASLLWPPSTTEAWLFECPANLDLIVHSQGERLKRGEDYLPCAQWPADVPDSGERWDHSDHSCCSVCDGTWETLCDLSTAKDPETAEACWTGCAQRRMNGLPEPTHSQDEGPARPRDWPQVCCADCGARRSSRCTVSDNRDPSEVATCFSSCADEFQPPQPDQCWWDLGFEPGISLRGRYEVVLTDTGFTATCQIKRADGEVLEFAQLGRRGKAP